MEQQRGVDQGMRIISYLVSGLLVYGLAGWALDQWLNTGVFLPTGIILGSGLGMYTIIRRYGQ